MTAASAPRRSAAEQAHLDTALVDLFERRISFNRTLGIVVESVRYPAPRIRLPMRPELIGHFLHGRLHGGVISATLDALGGLALMVALGERHAAESAEQVLHRFGRLGTIDLRVDYLRPGVGEAFVGTADVLRLGGRIGTTQMKLADEGGEVVATATAAYVVS